MFQKATRTFRKLKPRLSMSAPMEMIIDTDCGVDDAEAILLACDSPNVHIIGITCLSGNTRLENVLGNVLRILDVGGRPEVPVFRGTSATLLGLEMRDGAGQVHGSDGFGGIAAQFPVDLGRIQKTPAAEWLVRTVRERPGRVHLVTLGPLSNVAVACRLDPAFAAALASLTVMGGNVHGKGNVTTSAEFNFACDPEAAASVLNTWERLGKPLTLVPWETCKEESLVDWGFFDQQLSRSGARAEFLRQFLKHTTTWRKQTSDGYYSCDLLAMVAAIDPSAIQKASDEYVAVELAGTLTRGQCVVDWNRKLAKKTNAHMVRSFHLDHIRNVYKTIFTTKS